MQAHKEPPNSCRYRNWWVVGNYQVPSIEGEAGVSVEGGERKETDIPMASIDSVVVGEEEAEVEGEEEEPTRSSTRATLGKDEIAYLEIRKWRKLKLLE